METKQICVPGLNQGFGGGAAGGSTSCGGGASDADELTYTVKDVHTEGSVGAELAQIRQDMSGKAAASHTHTKSQITDLSLTASDVTFNPNTTYDEGTVGAALKVCNADTAQAVINGVKTECAEYVNGAEQYMQRAESASNAVVSTSGIEAFDSHKTYVVGEFCSYTSNGVSLVYKCKAAHSGAWSDDDFEQTNIISEIVGMQAYGSYNKEEVIVTVTGFDTTVTSVLAYLEIYGQSVQEFAITAADGWTKSLGMVDKDAQYKVYVDNIDGYSTPDGKIFMSQLRMRNVVFTYGTIPCITEVGSYANVETGSNPAWGYGENRDAINRILSTDGSGKTTYGTFVIDEVHKKIAKLDPTNHSKFLDGTAWSGTYGNCFRRLPRVYYYYQANENGVGGKIWVSDKKCTRPDDGTICNFWEESWIGNYKLSTTGSGDTLTAHSKPNTTAKGECTMLQFWNAAQCVGEQYGLVNYFHHCKLMALHLVKFGTANSETTMGFGLTRASSPEWKAELYNPTSGCTARLGDGTGSVQYPQNTSYNQNKLFGIEALAGSQWEFRPNIRFDGVESTVYDGNIVSNTASGRTFNRDAGTNLTSSYIKNMALGENFDMIPTVGGGSASTYYCDGSWSSAAGQLLRVGGHSDHGSLCGLAAADSSSSFSGSGAADGARLAYAGTMSEFDFVSGNEIATLNA